MGKGGYGLGGRIGSHWGWDWLRRCVNYSSRGRILQIMVVSEGMMRLVVGERDVDNGETLELIAMVRDERLSWVGRETYLVFITTALILSDASRIGISNFL